MPHKAFLLASLSGRVLAKAAARAGRPAVGVDAFADRDTCGLALEWARAPLDHDWNVDAAAMQTAADGICPNEYCLGLVYGSGFEARPDLLRTLARTRPLLGNTPDVLETVASPTGFSALLHRLSIPHPETTLSRPAQPEDWLRKRAGACGGLHVQPAGETEGNDSGYYFQRQVMGQEWSLLFLANGREVCQIGFNRPLQPPPEAPSPWAYSGAVRQSHGPEGVAGSVLEAAELLTQHLGLKGLNGLDFMVTEQGWALLELNPRPTATVELWDTPPFPPLFDLHVQACNGRLPVHLPRPLESTAVAVVYAPQMLMMHAAFPWPTWCADLPRIGQAIATGHPICTVHAEGENHATAEYAVLSRQMEIIHRLTLFQPLDKHDDTARAESAQLITSL